MTSADGLMAPIISTEAKTESSLAPFHEDVAGRSVWFDGSACVDGMSLSLLCELLPGLLLPDLLSLFTALLFPLLPAALWPVPLLPFSCTETDESVLAIELLAAICCRMAVLD